MNERTFNTPALSIATVAVALGIAILGCADPDERTVLPSVGAQSACLDVDEDGHGANCALGPDCDDADPELTGACERELVPCEDGDVRDCSVKLPTHDETENCFVGVQVCASADWGPCVEAGDV